MNEYDVAPANPTFLIRGHKVLILSSSMAKITIIPPGERNGKETPEQREFLERESEKVVEYLILENFLAKGTTLNITVESK